MRIFTSYFANYLCKTGDNTLYALNICAIMLLQHQHFSKENPMHNNAIVTANRVVYQEEIFPDLADRFGYLTNNHEKLIHIMDLIDLNEIYPRSMWDAFFGRPPAHRHAFVWAFVARIIWNIKTSKDLIAYLKVDRVLRAICGFDSRSSEIPSESAFSREFAQLSELNIGDKIHAYMVKAHCSEQLYEYGAIDSSAIEVAESAVVTKKPAKEQAKKNSAGEEITAKGITAPQNEGFVTEAQELVVGVAQESVQPIAKTITRVVSEAVTANNPEEVNTLFDDKKYTAKDQLSQQNKDIIALLPSVCNFGCKTDSKGYKYTWKGYKLHVVVNEFSVPIVSLVTSASVNDIMCAIPLIRNTEATADVLYYLGDKGYDAVAIHDEIKKFDKVGLIDFNRRGNPKDVRSFTPQQKSRYGNRSFAESCFSTLKMQYLPAYILFRGVKKVKCLLNLALSVITAAQIIKFA